MSPLSACLCPPRVAGLQWPSRQVCMWYWRPRYSHPCWHSKHFTHWVTFLASYSILEGVWQHAGGGQKTRAEVSSNLSFYHRGPRGGTQVTRLSGNRFYPLSPLTDPYFVGCLGGVICIPKVWHILYKGFGFWFLQIGFHTVQAGPKLAMDLKKTSTPSTCLCLLLPGWDCRHAPPYVVYTVLGTEPGPCVHQAGTLLTSCTPALLSHLRFIFF